MRVGQDDDDSENSKIISLSLSLSLREILVSRKTPGFCADAIPGDGTFLNS